MANGKSTYLCPDGYNGISILISEDGDRITAPVDEIEISDSEGIMSLKRSGELVGRYQLDFIRGWHFV